MKKSCIFFIVLFLLPLVNAQNLPSPLNQTILKNPTAFFEEIEDVLAFPVTTNMSLPQELHLASKFLIGYKTDPKGVSVAFFVVMAVLLVMFFILVFKLSRLTFLSKIWQSFLLALVVSLITGFVGGFWFFALFFLGLSKLFGFLEKYPILNTVLVVVILYLLVLVFTKFLSFLKKRAEAIQERMEAREAGAGMGFFSRILGFFRRK